MSIKGTSGAMVKQRSIIIVGNGLAAWMTASALSNAINANEYTLTVVDSSDSGDSLAPFVYADSSLPSDGPLLQMCGLTDEQVIAETGGSFSHGIALSGWAVPTTTYIQPFGSIGAALGPVSFHQLALRLRHEGIPVRLANFSLSALAAQSGRYIAPVSDPRSVLATCQHGLHLDCNMLADILRDKAGAAGVIAVDGGFAHTENNTTGELSAVITADGRRVDGDLFIDCSGLEAVLTSAMGNTDWLDWSAWLPCNGLVSGIVDTTDAPAPYSHAQTFESGWLRHLPLQHRTLLNGMYVTGSDSEEQVLNRLLQSAGNDQLQHIYSGSLSFGRRNNVWQGNCVSLGTAAAVVDPLGVSNLQLLISGIQRLLRLLPGSHDVSAVATEYNRQTSLHLDNARDFAIMHYRLNGRHGEPFWDTCRTMTIPDTLEYKLKLYQSLGRIPLYDEEPFEESSWQNLFDEHGVTPRAYSRIADGFGLQDLQKHLQRVRAVMLESLQNVPLHADYLLKLNDKFHPNREDSR